MQKFVQTDQNVIDEVERSRWSRVLITLAKDWRLYVLLLPMMVFLVCFKYLPIQGILTGFKWGEDSNAIANAQWCGFRWLEEVLLGKDTSPIFWRAFRNTFVNSMYGLLFGFPIPIILALLFSEIKNQHYRSFLQVACYLPHFVSVVVVTTIIELWCQGKTEQTTAGVLFKVFETLGVNVLDQKYDADGNIRVFTASILNQPKFFRPIYQVSGVWEGSGYGSIVYFAAILAISPTSYEAARIDGASKLQQIRYVTFPGMAPTLTVMLIMRIGQILNVGYEKIILLCGTNQDVWENAEVISTYVYKMSGRAGETVAGTSAVIPQIGVVMDIFNALLAMFLVLGANAISRRVSSTSLF